MGLGVWFVDRIGRAGEGCVGLGVLDRGCLSGLGRVYWMRIGACCWPLE